MGEEKAVDETFSWGWVDGWVGEIPSVSSLSVSNTTHTHTHNTTHQWTESIGLSLLCFGHK